MNVPAAVNVRQMTPGDVDGVLTIAEGLRQAPQWGRAAYEAALDTERTPRRLALVAESAQGVVGFAVASVVGAEAELETIAVAQAWQRKGLARALWAALKAELRRAGAHVTLLEGRASNREALGLYGRLGFVEAGRRRGYYADPAEDAVLMRLEMD